MPGKGSRVMSVDMDKFASLHVEFWTGQTRGRVQHPQVDALVYVDKVCARLWSEYHMYADKIREAQTRGMKFKLPFDLDQIVECSHFETGEKPLTDSDKKDIDELMSNLFKSDEGPNSNLEYNLTTAHREYENYCNERKYLKKKVEKDGQIFKAKIVELFEEVEPFLNYEGFSSGNIRPTPDAIPESYSVESYNVANNKALLNALNEKDYVVWSTVLLPEKCRCDYRTSPFIHSKRRTSEHDCPYETPFRVKFRYFDDWVDSFWPD